MNVPPVKLIFEAEEAVIFTIGVAEATLFAAFPPAFPSTLILPPL